jgi:hypothetical protein
MFNLGMKYGRKRRTSKNEQTSTSRARDQVSSQNSTNEQWLGATSLNDVSVAGNLNKQAVSGAQLVETTFIHPDFYSWPDPIISQSLYLADRWLRPEDWDLINEKLLSPKSD